MRFLFVRASGGAVAQLAWQSKAASAGDQQLFSAVAQVHALSVLRSNPIGGEAFDPEVLARLLATDANQLGFTLDTLAVAIGRGADLQMVSHGQARWLIAPADEHVFVRRRLLRDRNVGCGRTGDGAGAQPDAGTMGLFGRGRAGAAFAEQHAGCRVGDACGSRGWGQRCWPCARHWKVGVACRCGMSEFFKGQ